MLNFINIKFIHPAKKSKHNTFGFYIDNKVQPDYNVQKYLIYTFGSVIHFVLYVLI